MLAKNGSDLLWLSGLIFGIIGAIILAALAGVEGADWIAALLLFFGIPPFVLACVCLIAGLVRRHKWKKENSSSVVTPTKPGWRTARLGLGIALICLGAVPFLRSAALVIYIFYGVISIDVAAAFMTLVVGLLSPMLWIGIGLMYWGFTVFRKARRAPVA